MVNNDIINQGVSKLSCKEWKTQDLDNFLNVDYWDTMEHLIKTTWLSISKEEKAKITRKTFNENTRIAIWSLNALFLGAIEEYEQRIEKSEKNIKNLAALFQTYKTNIEKFKKEGRKEFIKWKK